jgi:transposase
MNTVYFLRSSDERTELLKLIRTGNAGARVIGRARILFKLDDGSSFKNIARDVLVSEKTVHRIYDRYKSGGLKRALYDLPRPGQPSKLDQKAEAHLVLLACGEPPKGRDRWTLVLLQKQMMKDKQVESISDVCILRYLTKRAIKPWVEKNVVHAEDNSGISQKYGGRTQSLRKTV